MVNFNRTIILTGLLLASASSSATNLNIYGVGHLSVDSIDDGQDSSIYTASNSSRLGFSGSSQMKNNWTAFFQYETGLDPTSQGTNDGNGPINNGGEQIYTNGRPSFVGLEGAFGKALIGHMPAGDQWINDYNLFADQVGDAGNLWAASGIPGRANNVIHYASPDMGGLNGAVTYLPAENTPDSDSLLFKGNYSADSLKLGIAYLSKGEAASAGPNEHITMAVTASYNMENFTFGGGFQSETDAGGIAGNDVTNISIGGSMKLNETGTVKAHYVALDAEAVDSNASMIALGYDHACDDNTTIYAAFAQTSNDANAAYISNGKGHGDAVAVAPGDDSMAISFGIIAKFDANLMK